MNEADQLAISIPKALWRPSESLLKDNIWDSHFCDGYHYICNLKFCPTALALKIHNINIVAIYENVSVRLLHLHASKMTESSNTHALQKIKMMK